MRNRKDMPFFTYFLSRRPVPLLATRRRESPGQKYEKNRRRRPLHEAFAPVFHPFRLEGAVYQHFHSEPKETLGGIHNYASAIFMQNL